MESLRIGGQIPASAAKSMKRVVLAPAGMTGPPPALAAAGGGASLTGPSPMQADLAPMAVAVNHNGAGAQETPSSTVSSYANSHILDTQAEYERRFQKAIADGDYQFVRFQFHILPYLEVAL